MFVPCLLRIYQDAYLALEPFAKKEMPPLPKSTCYEVWTRWKSSTACLET
ncbi:hypothetical protein ZOSMA_216G00240 [Zostera marina]|uniref:Uncharacterized protein n=1 Tax=Zostera marina TaxID=29655 RepID=A0A0K9PK58_ZOSMR|nr:hypothetical protein ZOSMA_216G00240 [Zostera marina]